MLGKSSDGCCSSATILRALTKFTRLAPANLGIRCQYFQVSLIDKQAVVFPRAMFLREIEANELHRSIDDTRQLHTRVLFDILRIRMLPPRIFHPFNKLLSLTMRVELVSKNFAAMDLHPTFGVVWFRYDILGPFFYISSDGCEIIFSFDMRIFV